MCRQASTKRVVREDEQDVVCMLSEAKFGKEVWAEAVSTVCYLINFSPHTTLDFKCPQEVWYSSLIDYSNLKIFRCNAYIHANKGKLKPRAKKCIFVGHGLGIKGYRV